MRTIGCCIPFLARGNPLRGPPSRSPALHIVVEDGGLVFVSRDGEVIEPALRPQFPPTFPPVFPRKRDRLPPRRHPSEQAREEVDEPFARPVVDAHDDRVEAGHARVAEPLELGPRHRLPKADVHPAIWQG